MYYLGSMILQLTILYSTKYLACWSNKTKNNDKKISKYFLVSSPHPAGLKSLFCAQMIFLRPRVQLFQVWHSYSEHQIEQLLLFQTEPGSIQVATNFSQAFQVWRSYSECLLRIAVAIPNRTWVAERTRTQSWGSSCNNLGWNMLLQWKQYRWWTNCVFSKAVIFNSLNDNENQSTKISFFIRK